MSQLAPGNIDEESGYGYGGGVYGFGLYGLSSASPPGSASLVFYPRIWSMDKFGTVIVLTPGDPATDSTSNLYQWDFSFDTAPTLIPGAPPAVKWVFVASNIVCTLGSGGIPSRFYASAIADQTEWTPGPTNVSYINTPIEQSGPLLSQASSRASELIFSANDVYQIRYVGPPVIWVITKIFSTDGIVGPKARVEIEDAVFWMGQGDFYVFDGYSVNVLPNNTVKRYVFDNINEDQMYKCFAFANVQFSEIWWFYPANNSFECHNYVIYNYKEQHWSIGTMSRSAGEEPTNVNNYPLMIQSLINRTIDLPNSVSSNFFTLPDNSIVTVNGNSTITLNSNFNSPLTIGDTVQITGATGVGGITAGQINQNLVITGVTYGTDNGYGSGNYGQFLYGASNLYPTAQLTSITLQTSGTATSDATGGGSSVTVGTSIMTMNTTISTLSPNQEVTISGVLDSVGGIPASSINGVQTIRAEYGDTIWFVVAGFSTSGAIRGRRRNQS